MIFGLAALYNIAFGIWACFWPRALFASLEMAPPNYPSLWQCLGMVVGLYGILYAYAAVDLHRAKLIIAIGLAGKILGPIGMFVSFRSGERLRASAPWTCAILNAAAAVAMLFVLAREKQKAPAFVRYTLRSD